MLQTRRPPRGHSGQPVRRSSAAQRTVLARHSPKGDGGSPKTQHNPPKPEARSQKPPKTNYRTTTLTAFDVCPPTVKVTGYVPGPIPAGIATFT